MSDEEILLDFITKIATDNQRKAARPSTLAALTRLIAAKEQAEKERDSFRRTLDERWEADKKAFAAIMRAAGRTHGVPPNKEVVTYFVEQNDALTARLHSMCEALEPFANQSKMFDNIPGVYHCNADVELWQKVHWRLPLTVGDLRRARAELDAAKKELENQRNKNEPKS